VLNYHTQIEETHCHIFKITFSYLGHKDESQDEGGTNEEPSTEESSKPIDKIFQ